jgi:hypothetical protein
MESIIQSGTTIVGYGVFLIVFLSALFVVLVIAAARMPADNPLRRILHAVSVRIAAFLGVSAIAIPVQEIPGVDIVVDFGAFMLLGYFCVTLIRDVIAIAKEARTPSAALPRVEIQARTLTDEAPRLSRDLQLSGRKDKATSQLPQ